MSAPRHTSARYGDLLRGHLWLTEQTADMFLCACLLGRPREPVVQARSQYSRGADGQASALDAALSRLAVAG